MVCKIREQINTSFLLRGGEMCSEEMNCNESYKAPPYFWVNRCIELLPYATLQDIQLSKEKNIQNLYHLW